MKIVCASCKAALDIQERVGFRETCTACDAYLHSCINCMFWSEGRCVEPSAEKVRDPQGQNFCEWFRERQEPEARSQESGSKDAAQEMWKKLTKK